MKLISILTMAALAVPCYALAEGKAEIFSGKDVKSQLAALVTTAKASGSGGATLGDYKSHAIKLSVRRRAAEQKYMHTTMTSSWSPRGKQPWSLEGRW